MDPFALLDRLDGDGDSVLSPYGIRRALDVVRRGARGHTRAALDQFLGPDDVPEVRAGSVLLAQAAWLGDDYTPGPALRGLDVGPLDPAKVNAWASEKTNGMIPAIVESFEQDEQLAITDAVYLDATWQRRFVRIGRLPFEGAGEVEMMELETTLEHAEGAVRLPYGDGDLRFVAMLDGGPPWRELEFSPGHGTVIMPAFSAESRHELTKALIALGLGPAFVPGDELEELFQGPGLKSLSRILQRARVDVDELGTRAAAVTAVMARAVAYVQNAFRLTFDRPFTWAIEHAPTQTLLFVGRVRHPRERSH
jgi:serine protease inhibitor